jgi:DNA-binding SARP family transcriptional activator
LGLWRGAALADAAPLCPVLAGEAARLEEARAAVVEERIECDLGLGRHGEVVEELAALAAQFPLRERLAALLMTALYRCGRRGEALAVFDATRRVLAGELGLDPGPELAGLQAQVLADDPALAAPAAAPDRRWCRGNCRPGRRFSPPGRRS